MILDVLPEMNGTPFGVKELAVAIRAKHPTFQRKLGTNLYAAINKVELSGYVRRTPEGKFLNKHHDPTT